MKFHRLRVSCLVASFIGCATVATAHAATVTTYTGTTTGGATYRRADADPITGSATVLSTIGTAVNYSTYNFSVTAAGFYSVMTTGSFDTYQFLYSPSLVPAQAVTNAIIGNDDLFTPGNSGFQTYLDVGTNYALVTSSFANGQSGYFSSTIGGPGSIVPTTAQASIVANASVLTFTGNTGTGGTFDRPLEALTGVGTIAGSAVHYKSQSFTVGATGTYSFLTTGNYDTFTTLYASSFDPTRPLTNVKAANDDYFYPDTSAFIYDLVAGVTYTFVDSGYDNTDFGFFSNTIGGPGAITLVPEPGTVALLFAGLAVGVGFTTRRRKALPDA